MTAHAGGRLARRVGYRLKRVAARAWFGTALSGFAAAIVRGGFAAPTRTVGNHVVTAGAQAGDGDLWRLAGGIGLGALVVVKLAGTLGAGRGHASPVPGSPPVREELRADVELGGALLVAAYAAVQATGGSASPIHPLVYALCAFLVSFHRLGVGLVSVGMAMALEVGLHLSEGAREADRGALFAHLGFISFFALMHTLFVQAEMLRQRRAHKQLLLDERTRARDEARDFRLISSQLGAESRQRSRAEEEEKLAQGAVETIHQALYYQLELVQRALDAHTCVLLWLDEAGERLRIKELVSDAECVAEGPFSASAGAIGTVMKTRAALHLDEPKRGHLPYYDAAAPLEVGELLAVPVVEDGHVRGVLCVDRLRGEGETREAKRRLGKDAELLLAGAAKQVVRVVQSERVFCAVERSKYEHERFYKASALLNRALTPDQVFATAFDAAREICEFDFAAITLFDKETHKHTIAATAGDAAGDDAAGTSFVENAGLVAMVVKNRHYLPAAGELRDKETVVFTKKERLKGMESLLVLPLICADEAIGTFVLASARPHFFGKDKRELLGVITNQVAISAKNAEMYRAMEEMATTDGLTGLVNHRSFQERFSDLLGRAERQGGRVALLLTDVDHFKKVNDTYGHPVGDAVLKKVAAACKGQVRKIDVAARYGGEEFAIVLDGTDLDGARQLAERIRQEVERTQMHSPEKGPFKCTLSLGIACFPEDGRDKKALIAHADQALYGAKHGGRNRAVAWQDVSGANKPAAKPVEPAVQVVATGERSGRVDKTERSAGIPVAVPTTASGRVRLARG